MTKKDPDYAKIAKDMGFRGLRITFHPEIVNEERGIVVSGAIFHYEIVQSFNIKDRVITLAEDYEAWKHLYRPEIMFRSAAPNRIPATVLGWIIKSIINLSDNKILYAC